MVITVWVCRTGARFFNQLLAGLSADDVVLHEPIHAKFPFTTAHASDQFLMDRTDQRFRDRQTTRQVFGNQFTCE